MNQYNYFYTTTRPYKIRLSYLFTSCLSFVFGRRKTVSQWANTHFFLPWINDLREQIHDRACSQSDESPSLHVWARAGGAQSGAATVCLETTFLPVKVPYDSPLRDTPDPAQSEELLVKGDSYRRLCPVCLYITAPGLFISVVARKRCHPAGETTTSNVKRVNMDVGDSEQKMITLFIKAPNQACEDQTVEGVCLNWTVKDLKTHLVAVYPTRPVSYHEWDKLAG